MISTTHIADLVFHSAPPALAATKADDLTRVVSTARKLDPVVSAQQRTSDAARGATSIGSDPQASGVTYLDGAFLNANGDEVRIGGGDDLGSLGIDGYPARGSGGGVDLGDGTSYDGI